MRAHVLTSGQEVSYAAHQAELDYNLAVTMVNARSLSLPLSALQTGVQVKLTGFNHKLARLHAMIVDSIANFKGELNSFDMAKVARRMFPFIIQRGIAARADSQDGEQNAQASHICRVCASASLLGLMHHSSIRLQALMQWRNTDEQMLAALGSVTVEDIRQFATAALSTGFVELLALGNISSAVQRTSHTRTSVTAVRRRSRSSQRPWTDCRLARQRWQTCARSMCAWWCPGPR